MRKRFRLNSSLIGGAASVAVSALAIQAFGQNNQLLLNTGFENPPDTTGANNDSTATGWTFYGTGAARASFYNHTPGGEWSIWLQPYKTTPDGNNPSGVYQTYTGPVTVGANYTLSSYWLFESGYTPTGAICDLQLDFLNASGSPVGPNNGYGTGVYETTLAAGAVTADSATWTDYSIVAPAPTGAAQIQVEFDVLSAVTNPGGAQSAFVDDATLLGPGTSPIPAWANSGSGNWNLGGNWSSGNVPAGVGGDAEFLGAIAANSNVYTDVPITEGIIHFANSHTYVLDGAGSLTLQTSTGNAAVNVDQGTQEINLPLTLASNTVFTVQPSSTLVIGNPMTINSGKTLSSTGGGTVVYNSIVNVSSSASIAFGNSTHANTLAVASTGSATVGGTGNILEVDNLSNAGTIDLKTNEIIVNYGSYADPIASIKAQVKSGYANGAWNGVGIDSSSAAASPNVYGIGYADAADPGNPAGLASGQIEVRYTLLGDANLDGKVNGTDFAILATNFNEAVTSWDQGDFNYDGKVNGTDFAFLATNFNQGDSTPADMAALESFATAHDLPLSVPEPATVGLLFAAGLGALGRRRRSS